MISQVLKIAKQKGFVIYKDPHKLNIWGFRSPNNIPNAFDDEFHVFTNVGTLNKPNWYYLVFKGTTDPGTYWLRNPMNPQGTAILNEGQYIDAYAIGLHKGKYKALVQVGELEITRDYNRDAILDFYNGKTMRSRAFGINIHRANKVGSTYHVDKYSAGCQVFKNESDFEFFLKLCELHRQMYSNRFTYTLIDLRTQEKKTLVNNFKTVVLGTAVTALLIGGYFLIQSDNERNEPL